MDLWKFFIVFFNLITSFLTEISYDKSLIKRNNQLQKNEKINSFYVEKYNESHIEKNENEKVDINKNSLNLDTNKNPQNEGENDKKGSNENPNVKTSKRYLKKKSKKKDSYNDNQDKEENERSNRPIVDKRLNEINALKNDKVEIYLRHEENTKDNIIKAIKMNSCFYCCLSKKKSIDANLLDESMKVITKRLDIMNIFVKTYENELMQDKLLTKIDNILMSDDCIYNINNIRKENKNADQFNDG